MPLATASVTHCSAPHTKTQGHLTRDSCCTDLTPCADNTAHNATARWFTHTHAPTHPRTPPPPPLGSVGEQIVDMPASGREIADIPVLGGGGRLAGLQRLSLRTGFQQLLVRADRRHSFGGPHGFLHGQVSTASPGPDHVDVCVPDFIKWVQLRDDATCKPLFSR